ncbi:hypothetical protein [Jongsikchunia kroppenstedtii]|uniref:hypothetical protein n=1 Tax=Jongsikchunia kroppenstedtii TaxID=1121721 RepID=UPI001FDEDC77|nr:hypothetical protein [Jongsikchunia kroppenstedtii]
MNRPHVTPGDLASSAPGQQSLAVDGDEVQSTVAELLEQVDALDASGVDTDDSGEQLAALARQAELLERAHTVLTETLDKIDRV